MVSVLQKKKKISDEAVTLWICMLSGGVMDWAGRRQLGNMACCPTNQHQG